MTKFLDKSFSSKAASDDYRNGWDAIFGKEDEAVTLPELPESEFGINECPPAPLVLPNRDNDDNVTTGIHFFGPQSDGSYTMQNDFGYTSFRVHMYIEGPNTVPHVYRCHQGTRAEMCDGCEELDLRTIIVYCSSDRFRAWLEEQLGKR